MRGLWRRRPNVFAFLILGSLILSLGVAAWTTGFRTAFWPIFLLTSAGDLIGGMVVLILIEPMVRQAAALHIRQHPRLDYYWFMRRVGEAHVQIRILDTFTSLFNADRDAAIRALRDAAIQGAHIRVLLMSPNTDASALRESQLRPNKPSLWINDEIQKNIADFRLLDAAILAIGNGQPHGRLELRLYTVPAPFSLYSWDERALFAFLPQHTFSGQNTQLEITDQSQLGREALDQFEAIWADAAPIPQLLPIQVVDEHEARDLLVRFVHLDNTTYLVSKRIDAATREDPALLIRFGDQNSYFRPEPVRVDDPIQQRLNEQFWAKYTRRPDASFHMLRMRPDDSAPVDRPREYDTLPTRTLMDLINRAEHTIKILDTSSSLMTEGGTQLSRAIEAAMARGVRVQVLLLAPTTQAAQDWTREDPTVETRIEENIRELRRLAYNHLQVRLYDRLPACSVHQIDDQIIVAFLPYQRPTSRMKYLEVGEDASLGQFAATEFLTIWHTARPLEGMRYADVRLGQEEHRLLLRIWNAAGQTYVASNRIERLIERTTPAASHAAEGTHTATLLLSVEDRLGERFSLSAPLAPLSGEGRAASEAFRSIFGSPPDAPLRRLDPLTRNPAQASDDEHETGLVEIQAR